MFRRVLVILAVIFLSAVSQAYTADLTGTWIGNDGGKYYIRQLNNEVWWYGENSPTSPAWSNIAFGNIMGNEIMLKWADVPKGRIMNAGTMTLEIISPNKIVARYKTGGFGGSEWTKGYDETEIPLTETQMGKYKAVFTPEGITWEDANRAAHSMGGYLATITSAEENAYVYSLVANDVRFWYKDGYGNGIGPWLGGYQPQGSPEPAGGWSWITKEPFTYTNWANGEPNNAGGAEDRLHFFGHQMLASSKWNDIGRNARLKGYIVEFGQQQTGIGVESDFYGNKFYRIISRHSNKCLDVSGVSKQTGANVIQWDCHGGDNQSWRLIPKGHGYYMIVAKHSNKCLDVAGIGTQDNANIYQWDCHGGDNQLWKIVPKDSGYRLIVPKHSNKCADVDGWGTHNGANVKQYSCHGGNNQQWKIE